MARTSLYDVQAVGDPAQVWNFDLFLPAIPGSADTRALTWKCMTTALPGFLLDSVAAALHGVELRFAGRANYSHTFNSSFLETSDWSGRSQILAWKESARSWKNNSGSTSAAYKVPAQIVLYDDLPSVQRTINIYGLWPSEVADIELNGGESAIVQMNVTWQYDWVDDA